MTAKPPTKAQKTRWDKVASIGCIIDGCSETPSIHHAKTGGGGRKDHDKILPLCWKHHQGQAGIHTLGRRTWQDLFGTEQELLDKVASLLGEK